MGQPQTKVKPSQAVYTYTHIIESKKGWTKKNELFMLAT